MKFDNHMKMQVGTLFFLEAAMAIEYEVNAHQVLLA